MWFWAIEWTFFATEIAAALVYYYGWDRLVAGDAPRVGWIYACSAWMSLVVINGILTFMLTPGAWPVTGDIWAPSSTRPTGRRSSRGRWRRSGSPASTPC